MRGLYARDIPVQLVDLSLSGCQLKTAGQIPEGSTGELHVVMSGARYRETLHVVRAVDQHGSSHTQLVGGQFAWNTQPTEGTMRGRVRSIVPEPRDSASG